MDLGSPRAIFSALVLGLVGTVMFLHGRKTERLDVAAAGLLLGVVPMVTQSLLIVWGLAGLICAGLFAISRLG